MEPEYAIILFSAPFFNVDFCNKQLVVHDLFSDASGFFLAVFSCNKPFLFDIQCYNICIYLCYLLGCYWFLILFFNFIETVFIEVFYLVSVVMFW